MPRLAKALVEEREAFARTLFAKAMDVKAANEAIAKQYNGVRMNPVRLGEIEVECKLTRLHQETRGLPPVEAPAAPVETFEEAPMKAAVEAPEAVTEASKAKALAYSMGTTPEIAKRTWDEAARNARKLEFDIDDPHIQEVISAHIAAGKPKYGIFDI